MRCLIPRDFRRRQEGGALKDTLQATGDPVSVLADEAKALEIPFNA